MPEGKVQAVSHPVKANMAIYLIRNKCVNHHAIACNVLVVNVTLHAFVVLNAKTSMSIKGLEGVNSDIAVCNKWIPNILKFDTDTVS